MTKGIKRDTLSGKFVLGRRSAEKISAVEGQHHTSRTGSMFKDADARGELGDALRSRIRSEFGKKK